MRKPNIEEIADEVGVPKEDVEFALSLSYETISLDTQGDNNDEACGAIEFLEDHTYSPEMALFKKNSREVAFQMLGYLKDREKNVLIYRYQLNGEKRLTLKNIGDKMGLSTETVRQIEFRALRKLRLHAGNLRGYIEAM